MYFFICSPRLWQDYGHSSCIRCWILVTFIFSLADNMDAVTYFVYVAFNITPTELHVIDGIPQLIFVRSSYTIEVRVDFIFMPLCPLNLLTLPIRFTEHPFLSLSFCGLVERPLKQNESQLIMLLILNHLMAGQLQHNVSTHFPSLLAPQPWPPLCFYYVFYFLFIMKPLRIIFIPL